MTHIYDHFGRLQNLEHLSAVQRLEKLKEQHGSNPWPVIEECFTIWKRTRPTEWKSTLIHIDDVRNTRADKKFAQSHKDPVHGGILRYTLDIPQKVMLMIRCLYTADELPMNRKFYSEFAKRFPNYKIAEKL